MTTLLNSATAIDLAKLPPPSFVAVPDFEAIRTELIEDFRTRHPEFDTILESDPAIKLIEAFAYRLVVERQRFNDAGLGLMIAYADGADLDNLAAFYGVTRLTVTPANPATGAAAVMESDANLRSRVLLAPDSFSVAGPEAAYVFHARSAHADVLDASATSPAPGQVVVTVQSRLGNGAASAGLIDAVEAVVAADGIRPLTDAVTVQSAQIVNFSVDADLVLFPGPDPAVVMANAQARLDAWIADAKRLGRNIEPSAIIAALMVPGGVQRVTLNQPPARIIIDRTQAPYCTGTAIRNAGYDY